MSNVVDFNKYKQNKEDDGKLWFASFALCLLCKSTWIAHHTADTPLNSLECPICFKQDSFASVLPDEYVDEILRLKHESKST